MITVFFVFSCKKESCDLSNLITSTVTDIDNHVYPTVTIDGAEWMVENLNANRFSNGDSIEQVNLDSLWKITNEPAYVYYHDDSARQESFSFGKLYNFNAITDNRNICPNGWHVSSKSDWQDLIECMDGEFKAGIKLKHADSTNIIWNAPNQEIATDESKFSALPQGARTEEGSFTNQRFFAYFWGVKDDPTVFSLSYISGGAGSIEVDKRFGASVRCVKD